MLIIKTPKNALFFFTLMLSLIAFSCGDTGGSMVAKIKESFTSVIRNGDQRELKWEELIPEDYKPEAILAKYGDQLAKLEDEDPEAEKIYKKMRAIYDSAPVNKELHNKTIRLPGFVAALENVNGVVTEFLLVPYFGACIHLPPPPTNQIIHVKAGEGYGIKTDKVFEPIWVSGKILAEGKDTDIGKAGYRILDAVIQPYEEKNSYEKDELKEERN